MMMAKLVALYILFSVASIARSGNLTRLNCYVKGFTISANSMDTNITSLCTHLTLEDVFISRSNPFGHFIGVADHEALQILINAKARSNSSTPLKTLVLVRLKDQPNLNQTNSRSDIERSIFIRNVLRRLETYQLDGIVLDWYFSKGEPTNESEASFLLFLKDLKTKLEQTGRLLGVRVPPMNAFQDDSCVGTLSQIVDFIDLRTFNFYDEASKVVGHHLALERHPSNDSSSHLSVKDSVDYWLKNGAEATKLNLGLASFVLSQGLASRTNEGSPFSATIGGAFSTIAEICLIDLDRSQIKYFPGWNAPVIIAESTWSSYDNFYSLQVKIDYAKSKGLGGIMYSSLSYDDARGQCRMGNFPILWSIYDGISAS